MWRLVRKLHPFIFGCCCFHIFGSILRWMVPHTYVYIHTLGSSFLLVEEAESFQTFLFPPSLSCRLENSKKIPSSPIYGLIVAKKRLMLVGPNHLLLACGRRSRKLPDFSLPLKKGFVRCLVVLKI